MEHRLISLKRLTTMLKIYCNGITLSLPKNSQSGGGVRSKSIGWSESSTRSNTQFLYSIDSKALTGFGYAFTFTIRDLPPTPKDWYEVRQRFFKRVKRMGLLRYHWVTEWQRRGVPHLHGCLYFDHELTWNEVQKVNAHWCSAAKKYVANYKAQDIKPIESAVGWLKYLAKHGSRSKYHYQRSSKPSAWDSSGRVWGKGGEWPQKLVQADLECSGQFYTLRRLIRRWRIADARVNQPVTVDGFTVYPDNPNYLVMFPEGSKNIRRIQQAKTCLRGDRDQSSVRGMSEWINEGVAFKMLDFLTSQKEIK